MIRVAQRRERRRILRSTVRVGLTIVFGSAGLVAALLCLTIAVIRSA